MFDISVVWMSILIIILAILFSVFVAIKPIKIGKFSIDMATGAILALLFLLLIQIINVPIIEKGILGNGQLIPWEIIIIFFSVAYVSISADITGIFDFIAYNIVHKANGDGKKLFLFFYIFACILTVFTSNDIVILTLTPIIFYLSKHAKLNVIPLLFAEFFGANTLSMFLYIGNPTNIIVGNALGLGFLDYTQIMWLPTIVAAIANFLLLSFIFKNQITKKYKLNKTSHFSVRNWYDAVLSSLLILTMLACLASSQYLGVPIWMITSIFAVIFIVEDLIFSFYYYSKEINLTPAQIKKRKDVHEIPEKENEFWMAIRRVPWKILPFIFTFFILVEALNQYGLVDSIATSISSTSQSLELGILVMGFVSFILVNIINNQPATILLANVLVNDNFIVSDLTFQGSAYALIVASNLGANFTLIGALAGLMWKKILRTKGLDINYFDFLKKGIVITPIVFLLTLLTLYLVLLL